MIEAIVILNTPTGSYGRDFAIAAFRRIRAAGYRPYITTVPCPDGRVHDLKAAGYVGFIAPECVDELRRQDRPVVNVSQAHGRIPFPSVHPDSRTAGAEAARHLIERGYTNILFGSRGNLLYSKVREKGALEAASAAGVRFESAPDTATTTDPGFWQTFLRKLSFPTGIVAADDSVATAILEATPGISIRVPEQLAVVGITNDEIACATAVVPLSSVDLNPSALGDRATQLLLRLIEGQKPPQETIVIRPRGVMVRASSDAFATNDPFIAEITRYVRANLANGLQVMDLARRFSMSRRQMHRMFRERTGVAPTQMLQSLAIGYAKNLLAYSELTIPQIAAACGYDNPSHFGVLFRKLTGATPAAYRLRHSSVHSPAIT